MVTQPELRYVVIQKCLCAPYIVALLLLALYGGSPIAAHAATYDVDTLQDDGSLQGCTSKPKDCSLRGAMIKANEDTASDTITLGKGRYDLSDGELLVTSSMNIIGAGAKQSIIDGKENGRVFRITGITAAANVTIEGVTITGGKTLASDEDGGGIKLEFFSTLSLIDSLVTDNQANDGGGLHLSFLSTLKLDRSTIRDNTADDNGGGIHLELNSTATLAHSHVIDNRAASGGGIFNAKDCTLALAHSTLSGNAADDNGGGIHNNQTMFVTYSFITGNHADANATGHGNGGGIFNNERGAIITHSHITNNTAVHGGGIFSNTGSLAISHSTIARNLAQDDGGGLFNNVVATIAHSSITNNVADHNGDDVGNGGGIFNNGTVILDHTPVRANKAVKGNAVYNEDTLLLMGNVTFEGNNVCDNDTTGIGCP